MNEMFFVKKYILRNAILIFGIASVIFILFFVVALIYDVLANDILISFQILGIGAFVFIVSLYPIKRFRDMIRLQENMFGTTFTGDAAVPLDRNSLVYLSEDWLIIAGQYAFYRSFIRDHQITIKTQRSNRGNDYFIKVFGTNGQLYSFHVDSASTAKKITAWSKTDLTENEDNF